MANNQDARPFVDLKKDAQEFRMKFDEDIKECLSFLDDKITSLICDPESFGTLGKNVHRNALTEFSKAKYDIFIAVKSFINTKECEWNDYIAEMKKLFIENVEIFLAGTKLEVKTPPSESMSSHGPRKSPGNCKSNSTSVTSFIYPILSTITKNIPVGDKTQFNRRGRLSTSSIKLANPFEKFFSQEEMEIEEPELDRSLFHSSFSNRSRKSSNSGLNENNASVLEKKANIDLSESANIIQLPSKMRGRRGKLTQKNSTINIVDAKSSSSSTEENQDQTTFENEVALKGRKGRLTTKQKTKDLTVVSQSCSSDETESKTTGTFENDAPLKGRRGRPAAKAKTLTVVAQESSSDEIEGKTIGTFANDVPVKGRKGRSAASNLTVTAQKCSSDENEDKTTGTVENGVPLKGRKGRSAASNLTVIAQKCSSDENEDKTTGKVENDVPLKGRRGRPVAKAKRVVAQNGSSDENESKITEAFENVSLRGRKGRLATKAKSNDLTVEECVNNKVDRGRSAKNTSNVFDQPIIAQRNTGRGRKSVKVAVEEKIDEPGPSKSPKKVSFDDNSSSDELDIQTPLARPVKSAARRKSLLPNLDEPSGADIIPGISSHSKYKRKTIGGVSDLETVTPSKRLKSSQKTVPSLEDDSGANDNLLESDDNYSEWISLKNVDGKIPTRPAVYEVKVWRAKKSAYIGSCESLRQKLTLYNLKQNSGHKHLDKFIDRNYNEIQVRYEIVPSFENAKQEVKNRINNFKAQHKNPPAYN